MIFAETLLLRFFYKCCSVETLQTCHFSHIVAFPCLDLLSIPAGENTPIFFLPKTMTAKTLLLSFKENDYVVQQQYNKHCNKYILSRYCIYLLNKTITLFSSKQQSYEHFHIDTLKFSQLPHLSLKNNDYIIQQQPYEHCNIHILTFTETL